MGESVAKNALALSESAATNGVFVRCRCTLDRGRSFGSAS